MDHSHNHIIELFIGYSHLDPETDEMKANCSVTLVKGQKKIILFDTLTAWDSNLLLKELKIHHISADEVDFLVCSHGHADHIGNLNLFLKAHHFVGSCLSFRNVYYPHDLEKSPYVLDKDIEVVSTPGHTNTCVSVIVKNSNIENGATVALAGDLFEKEEDIFTAAHWIGAGSENEKLQRKNRLRIAEMVDFIIPGHGPMFKVTQEIRDQLKADTQGDE